MSQEYEIVLCHHGIKGQKWGVRRYQNPDGTLTDAGRARLGKLEEKLESKIEKSHKIQTEKDELEKNMKNKIF